MMRTSQRKTAETATSRTGRCRLRIIGVPFFCRRLQGSVLNPREPFREPGALSIGGPPPSTRARLTSSRNVTLTRLGHRLRLAGARGLGERDWRPNSLSVSNSARRLFCGQRQGGAEALVFGGQTTGRRSHRPGRSSVSSGGDARVPNTHPQRGGRVSESTRSSSTRGSVRIPCNSATLRCSSVAATSNSPVCSTASASLTTALAITSGGMGGFCSGIGSGIVAGGV